MSAKGVPRTPRSATSRAAFVKRVSSVFMAGAFLLMMSQNIMAPNLTAIATDFNMTDGERDTILGGWMSTAFFLVGGPMSLVVGYLVDVSNRKNLFMGVLAVGSAVILGTGIAWNIWQLLMLRAVLGGVIGGILPLLFSLFGDLYPPNKRSTVSALVGTASGGGVLIGQVFAGMVGSSFGWRSPYFVIAMCGGVTIFLVKWLAEEPARGGAEDTVALAAPADAVVPSAAGGSGGADGTGAPADAAKGAGAKDNKDTGNIYATKLTWDAVKHVFSIRTNQLIFAQAFPGTIPWGVIMVFLNDFLSQNQGFTVKQATFIVLIFGIGAAVGGLVGGILGQKAYNANPRNLPLFIGICQIIAVVPLMHLINTHVDPATYGQLARARVHAVAFLGGAFASVAGPNLKAMLLNVNPPETRGTVFCSMYLADSFGKGVGPYVVSQMIQHFDSRAYVFNLAMLGWVGSGSLIMCVSLFVRNDEIAARARIRQGLAANQHGKC